MPIDPYGTNSFRVICRDKSGNSSESSVVGPTYNAGSVINLSYLGHPQFLLLPEGHYKLEVWGAQGGSCAYTSGQVDGGKGGYSVGYVSSSETWKIACLVGEKPALGGANVYSDPKATTVYDLAAQGGFNGGGSNSAGGAGGGATDFRLDVADLFTRIIVAGGGGGGCYR